MTRKIVDITCNICGESCNTFCDFEYSHIEANWGYGSRRDREEWTAELCEDCSEKLERWIISQGGKIDKSGEIL